MQLKDLKDLNIGDWKVRDVNCEGISATIINRKFRELNGEQKWDLANPFGHLEMILSSVVERYVENLLTFVSKRGFSLGIGLDQIKTEFVRVIENGDAEIRIIKEGTFRKKYYLIITRETLYLPQNTFNLEDWASKSSLLDQLNENSFMIKMEIASGKKFEAFVDKELT